MNSCSIFICGKAGSGKSFACKYLEEKHGYKTLKFAAPVYEIAEKYFDMKGKDRQLLIDIGSTVGRKMVDDDIWVEIFANKVKVIENTSKFLKKKVKLSCDDLRFHNEKNALKELGWIGLYLDCPDEIRIKRLEKRDGSAQIETLTHQSELEVEEFKDDLIKIDASISLEEMYKQIDKVIKENKNGKRKKRSKRDT